MKSDESDKIISQLFKKHQDDLTHPLPRQLKNKILAEIALPTTQKKFHFLSWASLGGGVMAMTVALILTFQWGKMSTRGDNEVLVEEVVSSHVRSLMVQHLSDVVSTDQHTVKPWFEGKIDFAPTVKDFAKEGFPLIGGRLDYIESRPTAALIYQFHQHPINLFQHPTPASESSSPHLTVVRGYNIYAWKRDGMSFWAVSDLNAADLQRFVSFYQLNP